MAGQGAQTTYVITLVTAFSVSLATRARETENKSARVSAAAQRLDRTLAALADPQRRQVVDVLRQGPRRAGELAQITGLDAPAMSRCLRRLREAELVEERHPPSDARVRIYSLRSGAMAELKQWLEETERLWAEQLAAFKAHVEQRSPEAP